MAKPLTLDRFAAQVEIATRNAGYTVEKREGGTLWLNLKGNSMRCKLDTAYQAYLGAPHRLQDIIDAHLRALKQVPAIPVPPDHKTMAESFLPLLQQAQWAEQKTQDGAGKLLYRPFVTGLVITYVFDMPEYRAYVNENMLQEILAGGRTSLDTFQEYALNNLRLRVANHKIATAGTGRQMLITCETQEGYAATSILLPEMLDGWAKKIPGRLLIGIPNRDFIIAFSDQHPAGVDKIAAQVRRDARERQNPLLSRLLVWEGGKLREYTPLH